MYYYRVLQFSEAVQQPARYTLYIVVFTTV